MLAVLVEDVGVTFNGIHPRTLVNLGQDAIKRSEDTPSLDELVEISCDNEVRVFIQGEDRIDEILEWDELPTKIEHKQMYTPRQP